MALIGGLRSETHPESSSPCSALNAAALLSDLALAHPLRDCEDIQSHLYGIIWDLENVPLMRAEVTWYPDGGFIKDGIKYARAAVTTEDEVTWAEVLPPGTSIQLELRQDSWERIHVY